MSIINAFKRPSATLQRPPLVELSANTPINLERQSFPDLLEDEDGDDEEDAGKEVIDLTGEKDKQMPEFLKVSPRKKSRPALGPTNINVSPQQDQHDQRDVSPDLLEEEDEEEIEVSFQSTESDENEENMQPQQQQPASANETEPQLYTVRHIYTPRPAKGQQPVKVECTAIIPIHVTFDGDIDVNVLPSVDESGDLDNLTFTVCFFAKILSAKAKIIAKNLTITMPYETEPCKGLRLTLEGINLWIPCVYRTIRNPGTCSVIKVSGSYRVHNRCFGCDSIHSNIKVNTTVRTITHPDALEYHILERVSR